jgi:hypothetical protein
MIPGKMNTKKTLCVDREPLGEPATTENGNGHFDPATGKFKLMPQSV